MVWPRVGLDGGGEVDHGGDGRAVLRGQGDLDRRVRPMVVITTSTDWSFIPFAGTYQSSPSAVWQPVVGS